ncbi:SDR family oxidoreductase [Azoarcus indigens]|uniref:NAD(P)-dependent dehydrogenase (Short-subunit alcohol dehydrogenase family) n=1 Tax=Azoarcus indigens TaxID=29545 RepID=A0A4R6E2U1_9RHOO|nr:SDR family oxidoreductase [Azoarcus indigens]NMG66179.1 SDR family oxidoreductase [Azoarcus indigens]TDN51359.1 NAD(P)-dependent dehydrogenase (short-subunit alcohol dehydrogenase family) [Azoarcus indigens]
MHALLTGHSRGLGEAIADALLARGIPVLALSRHGNTALAARHPGLLTEVALDLADGAALERWLADGALARLLPPDAPALLVNNAGVLQPVGAPGEQGAAAILRAVTVNVAAPLMLADALIATRQGSAERRILHVSSGAARSPYAGWSLYCATKAALDHHARSVALDGLAGVRICSLAPGVIDTEMQGQIRATPAERFPLKARFEQLKQDGGLSSPADTAARLVDYLLSAGYGGEPVADLRTLASG